MIRTRYVAQALVDASIGASDVQQTALCAAAVDLLTCENRGTAMHGFPTLVSRLLRKRCADAESTLMTPSGDTGPSVGRIAALLTGLFGKPISVTEQAEPSLIGGGVLRIGDECLDASVETALTDLHTTLAPPVRSALAQF